MAARIDRVEKEFILVTSAEATAPARIQALGRTLVCSLKAASRDCVRFTLPLGEASYFKTWETVSVYFDFRGQGFVFETTVRKVDKGILELAFPESMYRGLSRHWPRVSPPADLSVDILLPDGSLKLACPVSREYVEVDLPESRGGLRADSLGDLILSFKDKADTMADENRVIMFRDGRGPLGFGEELVSTYGRALFIPSFTSGLPMVDPYPEGRVLTKPELESLEPGSLADKSALLEAFLGEEGLHHDAALWCPVRYYRYTIGVVHLSTRRGSRRAFDYRALDFAWDFSSLLAWFLKRHGYYDHGDIKAAPRRGALVDASTTGLLVGLGAGQPRLKPGVKLNLLVGLNSIHYECLGRVARRFEKDGRSYYGLALEGLEEEVLSALSQGLYGAKAPSIVGLGG